MLDDSNLSQLKLLKKQIDDQKVYAEGIVKATQRRFGFVVTEDGKEIYLPPDEMEKVFPGDRVKILVITDQPAVKSKGKKQKNSPKAKTRGKLLKLIEAPLTEFTGRYIIKGKGHFVEPDVPNMNRWIFIPSGKRKEAKDGDYIRCKITQHPYPQARPQAAILKVIGSIEKLGIEAEYVISKFQLEQNWKEDWKESLQELTTENRENLENINFITIDSASTVDMDDALYAESNEQGWQLRVAIADPCELIKEGSPLEEEIRKRGTSVYLPGRSIPMLPAELSNDSCSLLPNQPRPVIVCTMDIKTDGAIDGFHFCEALITSKSKLSYNEVFNYLSEPNETANCHENAATLSALQQVAESLLRNREANNIVHDGRPNFRLCLNNKRKLERIERLHKNTAHSLVEECMVAANRCASDWLGDKGVFITHAGFRQERIADVKKLAEEQLGVTDIDPTSVDGFRRLMNSINDGAIEFPIRSVLSRLLARSRISDRSLPHYGMGLDNYTTFTSPIRKYSDFLVHRLIKQKLRSKPLEVPSQDVLDELQQKLDETRQARAEMEKQLKCQFMAPFVNNSYTGHVSQINSNGFTVRLDDIHIEGFVDTRLLPDKYSFDPMRLRLTSKKLSVELDQAITIIVSEVDCEKLAINFTLPEIEAEETLAPTG